MVEKINLLELYKDNIIKDGGHKVNVPIRKANGKEYDGFTYSIPLKYLYYNDLNGRIGVALSEYESENEQLIPGHNEEYNMVIQGFLAEEDGKTKKEMEILKRDIGIKGQAEPGYVLSDGRVIDGNRRFTAKRLLEQDEEIMEQQYFEAVILDDLCVENQDDLKRIKSLELQIQFGKLGKVDYDPIDRAIDAYKTICVNNIMSAKEYSEYSNIKITEVNKRIYEAELIVKFLEFINTNKDNYAIAKQLDLDGPLQDLVPQYKNIKKSDNLDQILNTIFSKILQIRISKEDFKKEYRQIIKNVINSSQEEGFIEEIEDDTDVITDFFDSNKKIKNNIDLFKRLNENKQVQTAIANVKSISKKYSEKAENEKQKNTPIKLVEKAINSIESINRGIICSLTKEDKTKLINELKKLKSQVDNLILKEE
ncbi:putative uncharacterized protein [Clostridium sp. CAG:221]|uniref:hypothetical protein n=1 Tax=Clostridium sp. CAG:221 TaxID=1262780 RepID=UPI00033A4C67|nr:hypothetical protein [Clostridium sp. CAG:221]CDB16103.1 putative uncharacterized protein [Clostridium sp. CAG:221]